MSAPCLFKNSRKQFLSYQQWWRTLKRCMLEIPTYCSYANTCCTMERSQYIMISMKTEPGLSWIPLTELNRRVDTIPLPKNLKSKFTKRCNVWQASSGTEWLVSRLKSFKDCLMQSYASGGQELILKPEWFATTPTGKLAGLFGDLWSLAMKSSEEFKAVLHLVNLYTAATRSAVPDHLLSDIKKEIIQKRIENSKISFELDIRGKPLSPFRVMADLKVGKLKYKLPIPLIAVLPGKEGHSENLHEDILALAGSPLYNDERCKTLLDAALGSEITLISAKTSTVVGRVGIACEPGLKLRYFAAPNQLVQRALEPLKTGLQHCLQSFPWDCTRDQRKADSLIQEKLTQHCVVHSVDLSKATDNFPWHFQHLVLKWLLRYHNGSTMASNAVHLLNRVVTEGLWIMPDESRVKWGKGQPLGLNPSFPLFTMSHGLLLYLLNGGRWNSEFFVLGDDVVIFNDALHARYREVLQSWAVEISKAKSFSSSHLAQFAGVTYTRDCAFWLPKWILFKKESLLDIAAWWYPGLTKGLPDHDLISRVLSMPKPYGIGRNPNGIPLDQRFTTEIVVELLNRQQRRDEQAKASSTRVDVRSLIQALRHLDEGSKYALERMLSETKFQIQDQVFLTPTGVNLPVELTVLMHGTETPGYPSIRRNTSKKVDPYSLGNLSSWKQLFQRVTNLKP